jgi:competence protein ComEA
LNVLCACALIVFFTSCARQTRRATPNSGTSAPESHVRAATDSPPVNINTASRDELEKLPHIGPALAARIVEHRERYGRFRRPEHLILVRGLSDHRFREIRPLIVVE